MNGPGTGVRWVIAVGTICLVLGLAFTAVFNPFFIHAALDAAGSAAILGLDTRTTHAVSDRTIIEMLVGPGTFAFAATPGGPRFYDAAEAAHLRDAATLLHLFGGLVLVGVLGLLLTLGPRRREPRAWRSVRAGALALAAAFAALALFFASAFDTAFTLFHEIFFPQGNWAFDSATERMVQLYPTPFWELTSMALATGTLVLSALLALIATWRLHALQRERLARARAAEEDASSPASVQGTGR